MASHRDSDAAVRGPLDRWADWLLHGRQRGMSRAQVGRLERRLLRIRDRVLRGARLRRGQRVLDVGAGTGLLALEARRRVGPSGRVYALDISHDALRHCRRQATVGEALARLQPVVGGALALPFPDGAFDAVLVRSVLSYLSDKPAAVRELHRVLRPRGRASVFEPINSASGAYAWDWGLEPAALPPEHRRVVAHQRAASEQQAALLDFDERDLLGHFRAAGFASVQLAYQYQYTAARRPTPERVAVLLGVRPNPVTPSHEEAARAVLGPGAEAYLAELAALLRSRRLASVGAVASIRAQR